MKRQIHPLSIALTIAFLAVGLAVGIAAADTPPNPKVPPVVVDPTQAARNIEAARRAVSGPQQAYLDDFNSGKRSVSGLTESEIAIAQDAPLPLASALGQAEAVLVGRVEAIRFHGSGMEDVPATTVTYRVEKSFKGSLTAGELIDIDFLGGPYRQPTGEEVLLHASLRPIEAQVGGRSLLILHEVTPRKFSSLGIGTILQLRDGLVAPVPGDDSKSVEWAGRSEADLLARVAELLK